MGLIRAIFQGIKSLMLYPLRSMLTVLGIIFGVCSVIAMLAIGEGISIRMMGPCRFVSLLCPEGLLHPR